MKKSRSAKGINHRVKSTGLYALLVWLYDFRTKYNFTDASLYDVIFIYWYFSENCKGVTATTLTLKRYGKKTGYQALKQRLLILIDRGLIYRIGHRLYPSELLLNEMSSLELPEVLIKCVLATAA